MYFYGHLQGHLPPIRQTIQVRQTRYVGHCWRSKDELIIDVPLWTHPHGRANVGWLVRTWIHQFCAEICCSLEDLSGEMDDREGWRERIMETWGARGAMVIVAGYGHGDTSSNPEPDWLHFT